MKSLLIAVNAKYIHTNPAVRSLQKCAQQRGFSCEIAEFTINQRPGDLLAGIYRLRPDVAAFSCYIWNIEHILPLCRELKKVLPNLKIWLGGPEVSYHAEELLQEPALDGILRGEGEETFPHLLQSLRDHRPLSDIEGIAFRDGDRIVDNGMSPPFDLAGMPFCYDDLDALENRILYFETSRGCPFSCSYCLSSEKGVRLMPTDLALEYLDRFLFKKVRQVKFVDRTFNCNPKHADAILSHLLDHDNGVTNFHFEISADILQDSTLELIRQAREGQFQFEVGVQSTNPETVRAIRRSCDNGRLFEKVRLLQKKRNAHVHLDLIAGLPFEDYRSFGRSYDKVFSLGPDMLQLGFLKVLKGSPMEADSKTYHILCQGRAPYEVLSTPWLSFDDILRLKHIDVLNDSYLNSGRFSCSLPFVLERFPSPFGFFEALSGFYEVNSLFDRNVGKLDGYLHLYQFYGERFGESQRLRWLMKHDILSRERARGLPELLNPSLREYKAWTDELLRDQDSKQVRAEVYPFSPSTGENNVTAVLYDYSMKNIINNIHFVEYKLP